MFFVMKVGLIPNHYVYIKDFNRFMFNKNRCKNKKWFCKSCLQCFSSEKSTERTWWGLFID